MAPPEEGVRFLASSQNRASLLEALDGDPLQPAELVDRLGLSRSAIHRNLRELTERGWVRRVEGGYVCTVGGRLVRSSYEELIATVCLVSEYGGSLDALADAGLTLSPAVLDRATVVTATRNDPHAPIRHYTDRIGEIDVTRFFGITPVVSPLFNEAHQSLLNEGASAELLLDSAALSASKTDYDSEFDAAMAADGLTLYVYPEALSFGLSVANGHVFLGAFEDGQLVACFEWDDPTVESEARATYERYRERAREVETAELSP
ncbi:MAG: MarR family transcriptional regulator [Halalkalicoccus sp.]